MSLARSYLTGLVFMSCIAAAGCSADTGGQGSGIPKEDAPEKFSALLCDAYYTCECDDVVDPSPFTSEENCKAEIEAEALADIDTADADGLTYDEQCAADVLAFIDGLDCTAVGDLDLEGLATIIEGIGCKVFYGTDDVGDPCENLGNDSDSCVQGALCENGTCAEIEQLPDPGDDCEGGFELCSEGAICIDIDGGQDHVCELLPPLGQTCLGTSDLCDIGLACDQSSKKCAAAPGDGEECAPPALSACAEGLYCDSDTCTELPGGGEPCSMPGNQCGEGFTCQAGTCVTDPPIVCAYTLGALN